MSKHYQNPNLATQGVPKLIDKAETVHQVLNIFRKSKPETLDTIERICRQWQEALHMRRLFSMDGRLSFVAIGNAAMRELGATFDPTSFAALLQRKSNAYGDYPIESWGEIGVIIRVDSKRLRYANLTANGADEGDEPKRDTMMDILGYAVLGYRLVTRKQAHHNPELHKQSESELTGGDDGQ